MVNACFFCFCHHNFLLSEYPCGFTVNDPQDNNATFNFDFSSLCQGTDYSVTDVLGHTYYANVCKEAQKQCLPADCDNYPYCVPWQNTYIYGNAIKMWGNTPPFPPKDPSLNCYLPTAPQTPVACTKACQVLGVGSPSWSLSRRFPSYIYFFCAKICFRSSESSSK